MSQHRLPILRDELSFGERSERLMRDVRRRMDEDLQRYGFGRRGLSSLFAAPAASGGAAADPWPSTSLTDGGIDGLISRDFFQLRPSLGTGEKSGTSSPRGGKDEGVEWGSRESLDDDTTKKLYVGGGGGREVGGQANGGVGRVFSMNFDVKDYR